MFVIPPETCARQCGHSQLSQDWEHTRSTDETKEISPKKGWSIYHHGGQLLGREHPKRYHLKRTPVQGQDKVPRAGCNVFSCFQRLNTAREHQDAGGAPVGPAQPLPAPKPCWAEAGTQVTLPAGVSSFQPSEHPHFLQDTAKLLSCYWEKDVYLQFLTENKMMIILFGR